MGVVDLHRAARPDLWGAARGLYRHASKRDNPSGWSVADNPLHPICLRHLLNLCACPPLADYYRNRVNACSPQCLRTLMTAYHIVATHFQRNLHHQHLSVFPPDKVCQSWVVVGFDVGILFKQGTQPPSELLLHIEAVGCATLTPTKEQQGAFEEVAFVAFPFTASRFSTLPRHQAIHPLGEQLHLLKELTNRFSEFTDMPTVLCNLLGMLGNLLSLHSDLCAYLLHVLGQTSHLLGQLLDTLTQLSHLLHERLNQPIGALVYLRQPRHQLRQLEELVVEQSAPHLRSPFGMLLQYPKQVPEIVHRKGHHRWIIPATKGDDVARRCV